MKVKTFCVAAAASLAFAVSPALAGGDCPLGVHAYAPADVVADVNQSTPAETDTATSVPFPLPTVDGEEITVAADANKPATSTE
jgi:hypothetical protein